MLLFSLWLASPTARNPRSPSGISHVCRAGNDRVFLGLFLDFSLVFRLSACIPVSIPSYLISLRILLSTWKASPRTHTFL